MTTSVSAVLIGALLPLPVLLLALFGVLSIESALEFDQWLLIGLLVYDGKLALTQTAPVPLWRKDVGDPRGRQRGAGAECHQGRLACGRHGQQTDRET